MPLSKGFFVLGSLVGGIAAYNCPYRISSVEGSSMQPTLNPDWWHNKRDYVLIKRINPDRLDFNKIVDQKIVIARNPGDLRHLLIKRVTALPKDRVIIRRNHKNKKSFVPVSYTHLTLPTKA